MSIQGNAVAEYPVPRLGACPRCPVCGCGVSAYKFVAQDFLHAVPGTFAYVSCRGCGTAYQSPRIVDADLALCYPPSYFTHATPNQAKNRPRDPASWRGKLRNAVLARADGQSYDAIPTGMRIAASLLAGLPSIRRRARFGLADAVGRRKGEHRCLDVGAGNGITLRYLTWLGWQAVGLETDASAAEQARVVSGCEVKLGTLAEASFHENDFNMIYMNHVMEHLPDLQANLRLCFHLLKVRGRLVMRYPNPRSLVASTSGRFAVTWDPPRHLVLPPIEALVALLKRIGFQRIQSTTSAECAAIYRALARRYRKGIWGAGFQASVGFTDRLMKIVEGLCVCLGLPIGEEILIVAHKSVSE